MTATTNLKGIFVDITILSNKEINPTEKLVMSLISIMPNGLQMTNQAIADLLNISKSRVSHIVSKLVKLNLVDIQLIYKGDMQVDKRILTIKKAVQETITVVKKVINKAKQIKSDYVTQKATVGTQQVQQVSFGNNFYNKPRQTKFTNTYTHNWNIDELERLEMQRLQEEYEGRKTNEIIS